MEEQKTNRNHWTSTNIEITSKKISQEIYKRKRQAPLQIKLDDMAIYINNKITRRGIAKGLVFVQEDLNKNILLVDFVNDKLCENLLYLLDSLNNRTYMPKPSDCYVITDPALREIYAAQFSDRIVQHFYLNGIEDIIERKLVDGCCSCIKGKGTEYALKLLKKYLTETSNYGKKDCYFLKIDLSGYFMSIDRKQVSQKFSDLIIRDKSKNEFKED